MIEIYQNNTTLLQDKAYEYVKELILKNKLTLKEIYSETKLASDLGISRTPLRQALHRLSQDGYIKIYPSKGFMIRELTEYDMINTIQVRCAIEGFCTYYIAEIKDQKKRKIFFEEMEDILLKMKQEKDNNDNYELFMQYDHDFHMKVVEFVNNIEFTRIFQKMMYFIHLTSKTSLSIPGRIDTTTKEHEQYIKFLKDRNVISAYNIMMEHLKMPIKIIRK